MSALMSKLHNLALSAADGDLPAETQRRLWKLFSESRQTSLMKVLVSRTDAPEDLVAIYRGLTSPASLRAAYLRRRTTTAAELAAAAASETRSTVLDAIVSAPSVDATTLGLLAAHDQVRLARRLVAHENTPAAALPRVLAVLSPHLDPLPAHATAELSVALCRRDLGPVTAVRALVTPSSLVPDSEPPSLRAISTALKLAVHHALHLPSDIQDAVCEVLCAAVRDRDSVRASHSGRYDDALHTALDALRDAAPLDDTRMAKLVDTFDGLAASDRSRFDSWVDSFRARLPKGASAVERSVEELVAEARLALDRLQNRRAAVKEHVLRELAFDPRLPVDLTADLLAHMSPASRLQVFSHRAPSPKLAAGVIIGLRYGQAAPFDRTLLDGPGWAEVLEELYRSLAPTLTHLAPVVLERLGLLSDEAVGSVRLSLFPVEHKAGHWAEPEVARVALRVEARAVAAAERWAARSGGSADDFLAVFALFDGDRDRGIDELLDATELLLQDPEGPRAAA